MLLLRSVCLFFHGSIKLERDFVLSARVRYFQVVCKQGGWFLGILEFFGVFGGFFRNSVGTLWEFFENSLEAESLLWGGSDCVDVDLGEEFISDFDLLTDKENNH